MRPVRLSPWVAVVMLASVALTGTPAAAQERERWEGTPEERRQYFEQLRAYPGTRYEQNPVAAVRASRAQGLRASLEVVGAWRNVGPFGFLTSGFYGSAPNADGGRIRAGAIHPTDPRTLYVGAASGGIWRSTDGGATWTPLTDQACSLNIGTIAIDPVNPQLVYAGTGEPTQSSGCGLLRSVNGGDSWTEVQGNGVLAPTNGTLANRAYRLRIDRGSAGSPSSTVLLYAASNGLHRSTNSGATWTTLLTGFAADVVQDPATRSLWWAALAQAGAASGLYRSTDNGASWALVAPFRTTVQRVALAVTPAAPGKVWLTEVVASRFDALRVFDHATNTLATIPATGMYDNTTRLDFGAQGTYDLVLEMDPTNAAVVYLGGSRLYRSTNGGATFTLFAYDLHVDWHVLTFAPSDPTVMLAGNDGGVFLSTDGGNSWMSRNTNIATSQFYAGLAVHPVWPEVVAGGLQDNSSLWGFGAGFWTMSAPTGDGGWGAFNEQNPNLFWSTSYSPGYVTRHSWNALSGLGNAYRGFSIPNNERKQFLPPLVIDPTNGSTLFYATYRLWRTLNEGVSWSVITGDLTKGSGSITALSVSRVDSRIVWVGTSDGNVQVSSNGGTTFQVVSGALPNRAVSDVVADPTTANTAYVTYSGLGSGKVYRTTDLGVTWENLSTGLPDIPYSAVAVVPGTARLFVAGEVGVYASADNGATWSSASSGLPNVRITDLVYHTASGTLYVGTYGRGIWATKVVVGAGVLRGDVDRNGNVNAFDAALVQQALTGLRPSVAQPALPNGDANCNGQLDSGDVLAILQFAVGNGNSCVGTVK